MSNLLIKDKPFKAYNTIMQSILKIEGVLVMWALNLVHSYWKAHYPLENIYSCQTYE